MSDVHGVENDMETGNLHSQPESNDAVNGAANAMDNTTVNNQSDKQFDATAGLQANTVDIRLVNSKREFDEADAGIFVNNKNGEKMTSFSSITDDVQAEERKYGVYSTELTDNQNSTGKPATEFDKYDAIRSEHSATSDGLKHAKKPTRHGELIHNITVL